MQNVITIIPGWIYDFNLNPTQREVYGLINGLSSQTGYCYASNFWIANKLKVSERTISRVVSYLEDAGLVNVKTVAKKGARGGSMRFIYCTDATVNMLRDDAVEDVTAGELPPHFEQFTGEENDTEVHDIAEVHAISDAKNGRGVDKLSRGGRQFGEVPPAYTSYKSIEVDQGNVCIPLHVNDTSSKRVKTAYGESQRVYLTNLEVDKIIRDKGAGYLERCIDKLDSWIAKDPTPKKIKNGQNAAACFRSWVFRAVDEDIAKAKGKQTNYDRNFEILNSSEA